MGAGEWHGAGIAVQSPVFGVRCRSLMGADRRARPTSAFFQRVQSASRPRWTSHLPRDAYPKPWRTPPCTALQHGEHFFCLAAFFRPRVGGLMLRMGGG